MNTNNTLYENDEIEIDLFEVFLALKRKVWMILLATIIGGAIAGAFSKFVLTAQYTSTAMVYILSKETTLTSLADLQIGSQLTKDYAVIVTSRPVLEDVIENLGLDLTYKELKEKITIDNPKDTRILSISAKDTDPVMAKTIVDEVAHTSADYIGDIMEMIPPKMIEEGEVSLEKTSPSNIKNAMIGAMIGFVLVCGTCVLEVLLNDTIRTEDDIEKYLNLIVLSVIPERRGESKDADKTVPQDKTSNSNRGRKRGKGRMV